jgi:hypothetical protein
MPCIIYNQQIILLSKILHHLESFPHQRQMRLCRRYEPSLCVEAVRILENLGKIIQFILNPHGVMMPSKKQDLDVIVATMAPVGKDASRSLAEIS